jgi:short-subunit dehydrogenase
MQNLKNKTIFITGSSDGLGRQIALDFAKLGANVIVHGRDSMRLDTLLQELYTINPAGVFSSIILDVSKIGGIEESLKSITQLDILISNAGAWIEGALETNSTEDIERVMNVNLTSQIVITKCLLKQIKESKGQILYVNSGAAFDVKGEKEVYYATKWGLNGFAKSLRDELKSFRVKVLSYYPGKMKTGLFDKAGISKTMGDSLDLEVTSKHIQFMLTQPDHGTVNEMTGNYF